MKNETPVLPGAPPIQRTPIIADAPDGRLPQLLDTKALQAELGVTRAAAEALMRRLPVVTIEGLRKVYCRRADVAHYLAERTLAKNRVAA